MPTNPVWEARRFLDKLEDPFTMFPVESVADILFEAVDETETRKADRMGWPGVARKHWSVEDEHDHEKVGLLVGAIFVLGQAAITQTLSILDGLKNLPTAQQVIPNKKDDKLIAHAPIDTKTNLSKMVIINAVSNYFKHSSAWPEQWGVAHASGSSQQAVTIATVLQLGMNSGAEKTDNLLLAADCLGLGCSNPRALASIIQEWREDWARVLYFHFGLPHPG